MTTEERATWVSLLVTLAVPGWYFAHILGETGTTPVTEIDYQGLLIWNVGIMIVATIVLTIVSTIGAAIGASVSAEVAAQRRGVKADPAAVEAAVKRLDRRDERDTRIERLGGYIGGYALVVGVLASLVLAMVEKEHFWIANSLYAGLVLFGLTSAVVKIVAYRRGI